MRKVCIWQSPSPLKYSRTLLLFFCFWLFHFLSSLFQEATGYIIVTGLLTMGSKLKIVGNWIRICMFPTISRYVYFFHCWKVFKAWTVNKVAGFSQLTLLRYGFCKKFLWYKWTSDQLNFCPHFLSRSAWSGQKVYVYQSNFL